MALAVSVLRVNQDWFQDLDYEPRPLGVQVSTSVNSEEKSQLDSGIPPPPYRAGWCQTGDGNVQMEDIVMGGGGCRQAPLPRGNKSLGRFSTILAIGPVLHG